MTRRGDPLAVAWTQYALEQLDQAQDHIALSNSEKIAKRIISLIVTRMQQLVRFPMSGRSGRVPGTRELVISDTPFIAAYAFDHDQIVILAIYHGAQKGVLDDYRIRSSAALAR
jgi:toxin ParE1/3/4